MATWQAFIELLTEELGAENVEGGADDKKAVVTMDLLKEGSTNTRRQKVHFEYDGQDTTWISATSFVSPVPEPTDVSSFLEYLGKDWTKPAAVIVDGQLALRNHFSLSSFDSDGNTEDTDKKIMHIALMSTAAIGFVADFLEQHYTKKDP
ncbi:hypothetical protein [Streptomyces sp. NRRL S-813]|uniref:hypothetical protein n=1 Tax=Streptomyces sp. NRRL S-813 TaxID=1463919 RepID=UPI0004C14D95|nr:hypothetical protein [Streptomyces sp. NRRL S-813]